MKFLVIFNIVKLLAQIEILHKRTIKGDSLVVENKGMSEKFT